MTARSENSQNFTLSVSEPSPQHKSSSNAAEAGSSEKKKKSSKQTNKQSSSSTTGGDKSSNNTKQLKELRKQFMALERRVGLDIAENSLDYIQHMPPNQLAEIAGEMFLMIQETVKKKKREEDKKQQHRNAADSEAALPDRRQQSQDSQSGDAGAGGGAYPQLPSTHELDDPFEESEDDGDNSDDEGDFFAVQNLGPQLSIEVTTPQANSLNLKLAIPERDAHLDASAIEGGSGNSGGAEGPPQQLNSFLSLNSPSSSDDEDVDNHSGVNGGGSSGGSALRVSHSARSSVSVDGYETINDYTVIDTVGKGACGKVLLAVKEGETTCYAIKQLPRAVLLQQENKVGGAQFERSVDGALLDVSGSPQSKHAGGLQHMLSSMDDDATSSINMNQPLHPDNVDLLALQREVAIQKRLRHKNIVALYEVIDDAEGGNFYLVMQYINNGALLGPMDSRGRFEKIEPSKCRHYFRQLVSGLAYLEKHHVLHLDIKPDNILVSTEDVVYLADFGMSEIVDHSVHSPSQLAAMRTRSMIAGGNTPSVRSLSPNPDSAVNRPISPRPGAQTQKGTPAFMSPEMCMGEEELTTATDVWSLGVTLFCMLFGELPFKGNSWASTVQSICEDDFQIPSGAEGVEPAWIDILETMLCKDPYERTTLQALKSHPFLRERSDSMGRGGYSPALSSRGSDKDSSGGLTPHDPSVGFVEDDGAGGPAFTVITKRVQTSPKSKRVRRPLTGGATSLSNTKSPGSLGALGSARGGNNNSSSLGRSGSHIAGSGLRAVRRHSGSISLQSENSARGSPKDFLSPKSGH